MKWKLYDKIQDLVSNNIYILMDTNTIQSLYIPDPEESIFYQSNFRNCL